MTKLVLEVIGATDLMPKDGQGSANAFVEARLGDQAARTHIKTRDLNPQWNEKLLFDVERGSDLSTGTIEAVVYNHRDDGQHRNFLGQVRISGECIARAAPEAQIQRYPLQKRGAFSRIKGEIDLKIYMINDPPGHRSATPEKATKASVENPETRPPVREPNWNEAGEHRHGTGGEKKKKNKEKEVRIFHSIPAAASGPRPQPPVEKPPPVVETRSDFARAGPAPAATVMHMQFPRQNPEFQLVETKPPVAARIRSRGGEKMAGGYDLVKQMHYLYVRVVKAKDLPVMDITGSLDPYVEVKLGNYKGTTRHLEKNQYPVWNQVFAFPKQQLQSNQIEVIVKDRDLISKDDFVGRVGFELSEVPLRVPPDSPLAPQWYRLEDKHGFRYGNPGEVMLAVWMGTQADECFSEAWHADAHSLRPESLSHTRAKVYFSPKLYYLRVGGIQAQDVLVADRSQQPRVSVLLQLGNQRRETMVHSQALDGNHAWPEEFMFVAAEPFDEPLMVKVVQKMGPGKEDEVLGLVAESVRNMPQRTDIPKPPDARWFSLRPFFKTEDEGERRRRESKFSSKIQLRLCLEVGYHVIDESALFSSDLQPSSKFLRKDRIGFLELGILDARNLTPMKARDGRSTDAYCVAKYGNKWIRTRTHLDTHNPDWNEQYTWDVFDPCTVITVGVFDNTQILGGGRDSAPRDQRIGKVRIRLSTLEADRIYTHYYPLLALHPPGGLRKHGELQLAVRFTCTAWANMVTQYGRPLLPKMHYYQPIPIRHIEWLRHQAMLIVAARLARAEPPLRNEAVEYMLDVDQHMFSLRKSKANFYRIMDVLSGVATACKWFDGICSWRNPLTTCLVHILFLILVCYPELILPTFFLYLFVIGLWSYRRRPRGPPYMDAQLSKAERVLPDELDEEFDTFPSSRPNDVVRMRYDRMRSLAGRVQTVIGDLATQGERAMALLSWRDPRATAIFIMLSLVLAVVVYVTPFQVVAVLLGLYLLRHPQFRVRTPSVPVNFFKRLPAKSDMLL